MGIEDFWMGMWPFRILFLELVLNQYYHVASKSILPLFENLDLSRSSLEKLG